MNMTKEGILAGSMLMASSVLASGFGLYEASAPTYALGGAVVGRAYDASANFFNPATLTDLTNVTVTAGFMTEHPRARMKVNGGFSEKMDSGCFTLPHFHVAAPLPWNLAAGLGMMPEYGLGTAYGDDWSLNCNSIETTVQSFTVNPNLAWKWDDLSVGAGLRWLFFDFEQYSYPSTGIRNPLSPTGDYARFRNRLKGDNNMSDMGWQVGTKYDVTEDFAVGLVYKSWTKVHVDGKTNNNLVPTGYGPLDQQLATAAAATSGDASTRLELPQSITGGFNWDITDAWHLGGTVAWTQWSCLDTLRFDLPKGDGTRYEKPIHLRWKDTWRMGLAPSWDFAEDWTAMTSYVFETDCSKDQDSTMLPASDRHMLAWGLAWRCWGGMELGLTYGIILMDGKTSHAIGPDGERDAYKAHRGISHAAGFTVTYRF